MATCIPLHGLDRPALSRLALAAAALRLVSHKCDLSARPAPLGMASGWRRTIGRTTPEAESANAWPPCSVVCAEFPISRIVWLINKRTSSSERCSRPAVCCCGADRPLLAATSFGLAAACKCTALLWAPYLLWRGRPLAATWLSWSSPLASTCCLISSTAAPAGRSWFGEYASRFLKPLTASDHYIGTWGSDPVYNQSSRDWHNAGVRQHGRGRRTIVRLDRAPLFSVRKRFASACMEWSWVCWRRSCGSAADRSENYCDDGDGSLQALECGMVLLLMLLLSPMSSKAHFGTLVMPGFCLARAALWSRSRLLKGMLAGICRAWFALQQGSSRRKTVHPQPVVWRGDMANAAAAGGMPGCVSPTNGRQIPVQNSPALPRIGERTNQAA